MVTHTWWAAVHGVTKMTEVTAHKQVGEHREMWGEWGSWRKHGSSSPSPTPCPMHLFYLAIPEL